MSQMSEARFLAQLAGNLEDFTGSDIDEAVSYLLGEVGMALRAENCDLAICVRDPAGAGVTPTGWHPVWDIREGPDIEAYTAAFKAWYGDSSNHRLDGMVLELARTAGVVRSYIRRDLVDDEEWRRSPVQALFHEVGAGDRLLTALPVGSDAELVLTSYRRKTQQPFSDGDRELAGYVATVIRRFARRLAYSFGFGEERKPLTPRERKVLKELLNGAPEKEIARRLGLTPRTLHQYVVAIHRKLNVSSRAHLMARFIR